MTAGPDRAPAVVLVDDEDLIRELLESLLLDAGYQVAAFSTGTAAIDAIEAGAVEVAALVTDINLPGPSGWDVGRAARRAAPAAPVVYMTGAAGHEWACRGVAGSVLFAKPFALGEVVAALSGLLAGAAPL